MRVEAMKRRSRAGGKPANARPRKAAKLKARSAPEALSHRGATPVRETEVVRLTRDLNEAREQQTATSEVLQVISNPRSDLQSVFAAMLEKAVHICEAKFGTLFLYEKGALRLVAGYNVPEFLAARGSSSFQPAPGAALDQAIRTKRPFHSPDLAASSSYAERHPRTVEAVEIGGIRTVVAVPMLKDDDPLE
jgi:hypothetical protein